MSIDWKAVSDNLYCPDCGDKAHIVPGTDGNEAAHTHTFRLTREYAEELSRKYGKPSYEDLEKRVAELEARLSREGA